MFTIIGIVIFLAGLCMLAGLWLSLPASARFAPSQSFIDALPTWLQGPRRIVAAPKDAPVMPAPGEETPHGLVGSVVTSRGVVPVVTSDVVTMTSVVSEENHVEAAQAEVVHDEP